MTSFLVRFRRIILFCVAIIAIFSILWGLRNLLLPFILGVVLAYLLFPIISWIESKLPRKNHLMGLKRILLIIFIYILILAAIGITGFFTVPVIANSISQFIDDLPQLVPELTQRFQNFIDNLRRSIPPQFQDQVNTYLSNIFGTIGGAVTGALGATFSIITGTFGTILGFAALPVFLFYILKDKEKLTQGFYSGMSAWAAEHTRNIASIIDRTMGGYIRAQIILGLSVGTLDFIGLFILGIPFAPALAFWAALTELIPILGPWLGALAGIIVTLAAAPDKILWVAILYLSVQLLENNLLVPRIQSEYLKIHPAIILILLVIGGEFAGLWGIILIVPVTSAVVRAYRYIMNITRKEDI
ncbi:MAG: AI-2E family transporter [Dehalococcoidales bacterium]|nr:AI-2E family transporter [Dehalococcoidales bacterium]